MDWPGWKELTAALHADGVGVVLIEKLNRLASDLMIQESVIADPGKHGFELVSACEPDLMATDATRVLLRQMLGAVAQYDKTQILVRLRGARLRKKGRTGRCEGRKPYGFREGEQPVLERMRQLRAAGMPYYGIADQLNQEGVSTRSRRLADPLAQARINPAHAGGKRNAP